MNMTSPMFENAWWLCIPILGGGMYIWAMHKSIAKRMADMTGYTNNEKFFTISASLLPYLFMAITIWTSFTSIKALFYVGAAVYIVGLLLYVTTLRIFIISPAEKMLTDGPFRVSRNPMYVSATTMFLGICIVTTSALLFVILAVMVILQHLMILAEERACIIKWGVQYDSYMTKVPRYLFNT